MAHFGKAYFGVVGPIEGGYVSDPTDRGGETYCGIARMANPSWEGWAVIDQAKVYSDFPATLERSALKAKLREMVLQFFKGEHWDAFGGDLIESQEVAEELLDVSVNCGLITAGKFLQRALNHFNRRNYPGREWDDLLVDGLIGGKTRAALVEAVRRGYRSKVLKMQNALQLVHYEAITRNDESQKRFAHGWERRA